MIVGVVARKTNIQIVFSSPPRPRVFLTLIAIRE